MGASACGDAVEVGGDEELKKTDIVSGTGETGRRRRRGVGGGRGGGRRISKGVTDAGGETEMDD